MADSSGEARGAAVRVPFAYGKRTDFPAYAAVPAGATRGVVVLHELFGPQPEIERVVDRFARAGYAAVAPDLFALGIKLECIARAVVAMATGEGPQIDQIQESRRWLVDSAGLPEAKVGLIGFCLGGGFALAAGQGWGAVSTNYGAVPPARVTEGLGPVIGCYGKRDRMMGSNMARKLHEQLLAQGTPHEVHEFDGVGHSFLTDGSHPLATPFAFGMGIVPYTPEVAEQGWRRILSFFDRHLG